jgi:hypothetical protein
MWSELSDIRQKLDSNFFIRSDDPNCSYEQSEFSGKIGIKNNTMTKIQVTVTTPPHSGGSTKFYDIPSGVTEYWGRDISETILVKHSSSNSLLAYLGVPGKNLQVGKPK